MRILVTGGGGYLGCHLVPLLLGRGHSVRVFDRFCFGEEPAQATYGGDPGCEIVRGDMRRLDDYPDLFDGIEAIIHLAGLANDPSCDLDEEMALSVNLEGSVRLACLAVEKKVRRFVFASSCSVYGKGVSELLDEQSPTGPVSVYGVTKLETEREVMPLKSPAFEPVAARPATLFGWSPRMRFDLAINHMVATAVRRGRVTVMGGGNQWRPFVHVYDAARALTMMVEAPAEKVSGEVFNLGLDAINFRIRDLAAMVAAHFDGVLLETAVDDDDVRSYNVQFGKIRDVLGFSTGRGVDEAVAEIRAALADPAIDPFSDMHFNVRRMKKLLETPVEAGGEPVAPHFIALSGPDYDAEGAAALDKVLRQGRLSVSGQVGAFEDAFRRRVGASHAVAVRSSAAAIHLALLAAGVAPGDEVILPALSPLSTVNMVVHLGAKPVFADVLPDTLNVDPGSVEAVVGPNTKAVVPFHLGGQPCDLGALYVLAARHGIVLIEDACEALGAVYKNAPIGSRGAYTCFRCPDEGVLPLEDGVLTVCDEAVAARLRRLAADGMEPVAEGISVPSEITEPGYPYRMGGVSASMGLAWLDTFDKRLAVRRRLDRLYRAALADIEEIASLKTSAGTEPTSSRMIVRLALHKLSLSRDEISRALRLENIDTLVPFYSLHLQPYYRDTCCLKPEHFPEATAASRDILALPMHAGMSDRHVGQVAAALGKILAYARRKA